jgi:hypothetical protein
MRCITFGFGLLELEKNRRHWLYGAKPYRLLAGISTAMLLAAFVAPTAVLAAGAVSAHRPALRALPHAVQEERLARPIIVTINGTALSTQQGALVVSGRALVPMRSSFAALQLQVDSRGDSTVVHLPNASLILNNGSVYGHIGAMVVRFDTAVQKINGAVYVPLGLFRTVFGAVTRYDSRNAHVTIVSALQAQTPTTSGPPPVQGTVSNVDLFSNPPVLSLVTDSAVRTITLRNGIPVYVEDVIAGTRAKEGLSAVHVGDIASVQYSNNGGISEIDDSFRSRSGVVAAVNDRAFAFSDGHVVMPSRDTTTTLNGKVAPLGQLKIGDAVTVRSNPESLEVREIIASRQIDAPQTSASVVIRQCTFTPTHALRAHQELDVFLRGTPHGQADFNIGTSVVAVPMRETSPGLYEGRYLVAPGANFRNASVVGELQVGAVHAQPVTASSSFSAATLPPQIVETAPREGQDVNNTRPSIYASFQTPTGIEINPASISIIVGGRDVTAQAIRTKDYVSYVPEGDLNSGVLPVLITVSDVAGNTASYRWTFTEGP